MLAILALLLAGTSLVVGPSRAATPDLRLQPNDGPPGIAIEARGRDFAAGATGELTWNDGTYPGSFVAETDGAEDARIWLCGSKNWVLDGGDFGNGYGSHLTADNWAIHGVTVTCSMTVKSASSSR